MFLWILTCFYSLFIVFSSRQYSKMIFRYILFAIFLIGINGDDDYSNKLQLLLKKIGSYKDKEQDFDNDRETRRFKDTDRKDAQKYKILENLLTSMDVEPIETLRTKKTERREHEKPENVDQLVDLLFDYFKPSSSGSRSHTEDPDEMNPKIVNIEEGKPSLMLKVNPKSVVDVLSTLMKSPGVNKYLDEIVKGTAATYRRSNDDENTDNSYTYDIADQASFIF